MLKHPPGSNRVSTVLPALIPWCSPCLPVHTCSNNDPRDHPAMHTAAFSVIKNILKKTKALGCFLSLVAGWEGGHLHVAQALRGVEHLGCIIRFFLDDTICYYR